MERRVAESRSPIVKTSVTGSAVLWWTLFSVAETTSLLHGCAAAPQSEEQQLTEVQKAAMRAADSPVPIGGAFPQAGTNYGYRGPGCAIIAFDIAADGHTSNFEVLYSAPDAALGQAVAKILSATQFESDGKDRRRFLPITRLGLMPRDEISKIKNAFPSNCNEQEFYRASCSELKREGLVSGSSDECSKLIPPPSPLSP